MTSLIFNEKYGGFAPFVAAPISPVVPNEGIISTVVPIEVIKITHTNQGVNLNIEINKEKFLAKGGGLAKLLQGKEGKDNTIDIGDIGNIEITQKLLDDLKYYIEKDDFRKQIADRLAVGSDNDKIDALSLAYFCHIYDI